MMKKMIIIISISALFLACSNDATSSDTESSTTSDKITATQLGTLAGNAISESISIFTKAMNWPKIDANSLNLNFAEGNSILAEVRINDTELTSYSLPLTTGKIKRVLNDAIPPNSKYTIDIEFAETDTPHNRIFTIRELFQQEIIYLLPM